MEHIGKSLSILYRIHQKNLAKRLKAYGFGNGTLHSYLLAIIRKPGLTQEQITNETKFDKATTARSVKQLEEAGYVERVVDEQDRRSYLLYPTERAIAFFPQLQVILAETNQELIRGLSEEERLQLQALLHTLYEQHQGQTE